VLEPARIHGDDGAAIGASHETGCPDLVAQRRHRKAESALGGGALAGGAIRAPGTRSSKGSTVQRSDGGIRNRRGPR
jgi:hypothetical protein